MVAIVFGLRGGGNGGVGGEGKGGDLNKIFPIIRFCYAALGLEQSAQVVPKKGFHVLSQLNTR